MHDPYMRTKIVIGVLLLFQISFFIFTLIGINQNATQEWHRTIDNSIKSEPTRCRQEGEQKKPKKSKDQKAAEAQAQLIRARSTNQNGGIWPMPQNLSYGSQNRSLSKNGVAIVLQGSAETCDILKFAKNTYLKNWFFPPSKANISSEAGTLSLVVKLHKSCPQPSEYPQENMNEKYSLQVPLTGEATLEADEVWGILRGLETFSQMIFQIGRNSYAIRTATIHDWPEYPVRGILLDTSRHYLHKSLIKRQIDLMAQNKMNLLHWHIVDMESFPYVSKLFPNLSNEGAYTSEQIYSPDTVKEVIEHARLRGIRVMPEFDTPGHMASWKGQAGLLAECFNGTGGPALSSMIDPTSEKAYEFLRQFFQEVKETFPDQFIHLGGDEAEFWTEQCWNRNPKVRQFMQEKSLANITMLETFYFDKLQEIVLDVTENKRRMVFWQEVFDHNEPYQNAIIHIWKSYNATERARDLEAATSKGHQVLLSACWYLNLVNYGADWKVNEWKAGTGEYYYCDPRNFTGTDEQKQLVLGGVAAMWGEYVDGTNLEARLWPRASAVAERLWSDPSQTTDADVAWPRLQEHRCRMNARGYRAEPVNGPDFCPVEWEEPTAS